MTEILSDVSLATCLVRSEDNFKIIISILCSFDFSAQGFSA